MFANMLHPLRGSAGPQRACTGQTKHQLLLCCCFAAALLLLCSCFAVGVDVNCCCWLGGMCKALKYTKNSRVRQATFHQPAQVHKRCKVHLAGRTSG